MSIVLEQPIQLNSREERLDLVFAYVLGDVTDRERIECERRLREDPDFAVAYESALATFAYLPRALNATAPPPFIKERVFDRIEHEQEKVDYVLPEVRFRQPLTNRLMNKLPGYSNIVMTRYAPASPWIRYGMAAGVAFALLGSAYAFIGLGGSEHMPVSQFHSVEVRSQMKVPAIVPNASTQLPVTEAKPVAKAEQTITPTPEAPVSAKPEKVAAQTRVENVQTNLSVMQAQMLFSGDQATERFSLSPVDQQHSGKGKVIWNPKYADALFMISDLKPTDDLSHYVIWYRMDDNTRLRVHSFEVMSAANLSFLLPETPSAHVTGVIVTLEHGKSTKSSGGETVLGSSAATN